jgi:hypothetical protein
LGWGAKDNWQRGLRRRISAVGVTLQIIRSNRRWICWKITFHNFLNKINRFCSNSAVRIVLRHTSYHTLLQYGIQILLACSCGFWQISWSPFTLWTRF